MNERHLYRGFNDFQGSIAEDGSLYDERHNLVGRIKGNEVYDTGGIRQGTIDAAGKLWDNTHTFVGEERGANFIEPSYHSTGLVRGDSVDEGRGCEYGALMLLKKRKTWSSGGMLDDDEFGNGLNRGLAADNNRAHDDYDDYERDDYDRAHDDYERDDYNRAHDDYERDDYDQERDDYDDGVGDDAGDANKHHRGANAYHRGANKHHRDVNKHRGGRTPDDVGCGCMVVILFIGSLFLYLLR